MLRCRGRYDGQRGTAAGRAEAGVRGPGHLLVRRLALLAEVALGAAGRRALLAAARTPQVLVRSALPSNSHISKSADALAWRVL